MVVISRVSRGVKLPIVHCCICGKKLVRFGKQLENNKTGVFLCSDSKCRSEFMKEYMSAKLHTKKKQKRGKML